MAEDVDDLEVEENEGPDEGNGPSRKTSRRKMLFIIIGAAVLVVIGGGAGAWFTGLLDPVVAMITGEPAEDQVAEGVGPGQVVYVDLPDIVVNLNTGSRTKSTFLKIRLSLELPNGQDVPKVEAQMTRVLDTFNVFLRELRIEDLKGSAGMYRLREELLARVAVAVAPTQVNDVLFKEMLVN